MKLIPVDSHDELMQLIVAIARSSHTGREFERALNREFQREHICTIPQVENAQSASATRALAEEEPRDRAALQAGYGAEGEDGGASVIYEQHGAEDADYPDDLTDLYGEPE